MKKTYIIPQTDVVRLQNESPLAASGIKANNGIGYGGVDEDGELDPSVKQNHYNVWDDDWREKQE